MTAKRQSPTNATKPAAVLTRAPRVLLRRKCDCGGGASGLDGERESRSSPSRSIEVCSGIRKALGVKVGDTFKGAIYRPVAKQETIDKDKCCNSAG